MKKKTKIALAVISAAAIGGTILYFRRKPGPSIPIVVAPETVTKGTTSSSIPTKISEKVIAPLTHVISDPVQPVSKPAPTYTAPTAPTTSTFPKYTLTPVSEFQILERSLRGVLL